MVIITIKNIVVPESNIIERIINLQKKGKSIEEIRFELKTNKSEVYKILNNNLEDYKNYNIHRKVPEDVIKEVIALRKDGHSIRAISDKVNFCADTAIKVLIANLEDYQKYIFKKKGRLINDIITLRKKGKTHNEIAELVKFSVPTIRNVLIANLEDYQKYNYSQSKNKTSKINLNMQEKLKFFGLLYDELILNLKLPSANQLKQQCLEIFYRIWFKVKKGSKLRDIFKLGPPVIYMFLKMRGFSLNTGDIIKNSHLNRVEFKKYLNLAVPYYPEYQKRNNARLLVLKKINEIGTFFEFNSGFKEVSEKITDVFWPYIKNTTESVIVGVIVIFTMIKQDLYSASFASVCKEIGIRMSSVEYSIKNKVFKELHLDCFKGIKKSSELIKEIINVKLANFSFTKGSY